MFHALQQFFAPLPQHGAGYFGKMALGLLFMFAILAALQAAPRRSRKNIIAVFTFLGGLYFAAEFSGPQTRRPAKTV